MSGASTVHYCECGDHAWKPMKRGLVLLVSAQDADQLQYGWYVARDGRNYLMVRRSAKGRPGLPVQIRIAREITGAIGGEVVDHINLDTLDNRRENLRVCSRAENRLNTRARRGKAVPLKGVRKADGGRFEATITRDGKQHYLGRFATAEEAHAAYVTAAEALHRDFARAA
jgi:hypothetical protein